MLLFAAPGDWGEGTSGTGSKLDNWRRLRSSRSLAGGGGVTKPNAGVTRGPHDPHL